MLSMLFLFCYTLDVVQNCTLLLLVDSVRSAAACVFDWMEIQKYLKVSPVNILSRWTHCTPFIYLCKKSLSICHKKQKYQSEKTGFGN